MNAIRLVGWILLVASASGACLASEAPPAPADVLEVLVVDARDGSPLPGVTIAAIDGYPIITRPAPPQVVSDEAGRCRVALPARPVKFLAISASKEGFVPVEALRMPGDLAAGPPRAYTMALGPATPIGGTVVDARGRPIAGARVYVQFYRGRSGERRERLSIPVDYHATTDARGRWQAAVTPADLSPDDDLRLRLVHPDYVSDFYPEADGRERPVDALLAMADVTAMEDGAPLSGRVVDARGRPIAGARVALGAGGYSPEWSLPPGYSNGPEAVADADGRFRLEHVEPVKKPLLVEAPGYHHRTEAVVAAADAPPVEIRLTSLEEIDSAYESAREGLKPATPDANLEGWIIPGVLALVAVALVPLASRWAAGRRGRGASPTPAADAEP